LVQTTFRHSDDYSVSQIHPFVRPKPGLGGFLLKELMGSQR